MDLCTWDARKIACSLESLHEALECEQPHIEAPAQCPQTTLKLKTIALILDLAAALSPEDEEAHPTASSSVRDSSGAVFSKNLFHFIAALLTVWLEARVTLSELDERQTLRSVHHQRNALLWQPRAWRQPHSGRDEHPSLDTLVEEVVAWVDPAPARWVPVRGTRSWFVTMLGASAALSTPATPHSHDDDPAAAPLWSVLHRVFECDEDASGTGSSCSSSSLARPVVVPTSFVQTLFALRAHCVHCLAHSLVMEHQLHCPPAAHASRLARLTALASLHARLLVCASDAATIAHEQFAHTGAAQLRQQIQSELLGPAVHPSVQLSALGSRTVSGIGLVAVEEVGEGECVLVERTLIHYTRDAHLRGDPMALLTDAVRCSAEDALRWLSGPPVVSTQSEPKYPSCSSSPALLETTFARLAVLTRHTHARVEDTPPASSENDLDDLIRALIAPEHHLVKSITGLDTFKIGLSCETEVGLAERKANDWCYLRAVDSGKSIAYLCGLVNHSCTPNALLVSACNGEAVSLVALRRIEAGEEITISYLSSSLLPRADRDEALTFTCRCHFCATRAYLLEGIQCGECGHLLRPHTLTTIEPCDGSAGVVLNNMATTPPATTYGVAPARTTTHGDESGEHALDCPARFTRFAQWRDSVLPPLLRRMAEAEAAVLDADSGVSPDRSGEERDACTEAVRALVELDEQLQLVNAPLLPLHHVRIRLREHLLAFAVGASGLTLALSEALQRIAAELLESIELLLPSNTPRITDLRMHYVFVRARHLSDVLEAKEAAGHDVTGGSHGDGCCGAVRHEAMVLRKPFMRDATVRHCVIRCFQEHHVQCVGWRSDDTACASAAFVPCDPLETFLGRFPVELHVAGVDTAEDLELLACVDDGESAMTQAENGDDNDGDICTT